MTWHHAPNSWHDWYDAKWWEVMGKSSHSGKDGRPAIRDESGLTFDIITAEGVSRFWLLQYL